MFAWGGRRVREIDEWAAVQAMCTLLAAWVEIWVRACGCRVGSGYRGSCNGIDVRRSMRSESMRYQLDPAGAAGSMCRRCTRIEQGRGEEERGLRACVRRPRRKGDVYVEV